jgi:2-iminobutanoate/2-iminopropanoate deaminase
MRRKPANAKSLSAPIGPYSHRAGAHGLMFISGQAGQDPVTGALVPGGISAEVSQVFDNCETIIREMGASMDGVVKVNVFLTSMADFAVMNAAYARRFNSPFPARTTVAVQGLPLGACIEIEMIVAA